MELIGHRGCAAQCPENTVEAVRRCSAHLGAVEVDVRRCGTGELVVFHDETVDRLTDASGRVGELAWRELRDLDVLESGETVPQLSAVLTAVQPGCRVQLELKERGLAADVRRVAAGAAPEASVTSFDRGIIEEVRAIEWAVPAGYLFATDPADGVRTALDLDCEAVHPRYDLCLESDVVEAAHRRDLDVVAWKAPQRAGAVDALRAAGVDGVTVERWDLA